jgi:DNA (cytosine-5)-methyltransferase 1
LLSHFWGSLQTPFLLKYYGGQFGEPINKPIPAITANYEHYGLVTPVPRLAPFIVELRTNMDARSVEEPLTTITTSGAHHCLAHPQLRPYIVPTYHGKDDLRCHSVDQPFPTITGVDGFVITQPFLVKYNGTGGALSIDDPLHTISTRDRFGLVSTQVIPSGTIFLLDILYRLLRTRELAAAHSFKKTYVFLGGRSNTVKLIGNSVPIEMGTALCTSILAPMAAQRNAA